MLVNLSVVVLETMVLVYSHGLHGLWSMSMQSHSIECDCMDIGCCTNRAVDVASDSTL